MSNETTPPPVPVREGFLRKFLSKFSVSRDKGLREDLENVIETHQAQNPQDDLGQETKSMMRNLITFSDLRVDDVMVPRADIIAIEDSSTMRDLLVKFNEANHSRLPVYRETLDDVAGMIHVKDFMRWMSVQGRKAESQDKESRHHHIGNGSGADGQAIGHLPGGAFCAALHACRRPAAQDAGHPYSHGHRH